MKKKKLYHSIYFQLGLTITLFVLITEIVIFIGSYYSKRKELNDIDQYFKNTVSCELGHKVNIKKDILMIDRRMENFSKNILILVLIIIFVTVVGTLIIFKFIAGNHILKLKEYNEKTSVNNILYYPDKDIPGNEIGAIISTRNGMLKEIVTSLSKLATLGNIAANISHEISTPLNIIYGKAQLVRLKLEKNIFNQQQILDNMISIEKNIDRVGKIISGINSISQDALDNSFDDCALIDIVNDSIDLYKNKFSTTAHNIKIKNITTNISIRCRPYQVSQVILNLLSNSHDAISNLDERWIKISYDENENSHLVSVTDSGTGLTTEEFDKLIKPFVSKKKLVTGSGIGLGVSHSIMKSHNGNLQLDSSEKNTKIMLVIPKKILKDKEHL